MPEEPTSATSVVGPGVPSSSNTTTTPSSSSRPNKAQRNNNSTTTTTTSTGGVVRRTPPSNDSNSADGRPPTKRARKAINCEPCRNSKLKCDRNRPCSSCVLRGTSALCYQDGRGFDESAPRGDDLQYARIDPAQEISRLRHSINLIEAYIFPASRNQHRHSTDRTSRRPSDASLPLIPKKEDVEPDVREGKSSHHTGSNATVSAAPGVLGSRGQGALYAGSTSVLNLLATPDSRHSEESEPRPGSNNVADETFLYAAPEYDRDLLALLPSLPAIDELITFYFDFCNWIYRHVNQTAFEKAWQRFKDGTTSDRITLATACVIMSVATYYLPANHHLLQSFSETQEEIGLKFYDVATTALQRRMAENKTYSMDLVELLLVRAMYQTLLKANTEEIWQIRGELMAIGMAMGLHRDPSRWKMQRDVAERRRWAWWHIILLERWQAFLLGRPLTIASHHFDTQLPSYCDPAIDKTGRYYLPNIALFRLAYILGDIMDDAVSVRPVPYESVMANDRALLRWMEELPPELDLDEFRIARSLASPNIDQLRLGVQSVIIRTSYYHIRFTLHRPFAAKASATPPSNSSTSSSGSKSKSSLSKDDQAKYANSLDIAVSSADKLITMVDQSRPDFLANSSLAVPGHMNWGPWHCFSAAMFFSFQLIANPDQPGASLFRASIRKAVGTLECARGNAVADKGVDILGALEPLYTVDYTVINQGMDKEERAKQREQILARVRKLAFPYHDAHDPRRSTDSPSVRGAGVGSPAGSNTNSVSPPLASMPAHSGNGYDSTSLRTQAAAYNNSSQHLQSPSSQMMMAHHTHVSSSPVAPSAGYHHPSSQHSHSHSGSHHPSSAPSSYSTSHLPPLPASHVQHQQHQQHQMYNSTPADSVRYMTSTAYGAPSNPVDEMWGAAVGFGQVEWSAFEGAAGRL